MTGGIVRCNKLCTYYTERCMSFWLKLEMSALANWIETWEAAAADSGGNADQMTTNTVHETTLRTPALILALGHTRNR